MGGLAGGSPLRYCFIFDFVALSHFFPTLSLLPLSTLSLSPLSPYVLFLMGLFRHNKKMVLGGLASVVPAQVVSSPKTKNKTDELMRKQPKIKLYS